MADNYLVKDATGTTITKRAKDTGSGVQADAAALIDTAFAQIDPATKQLQTIANNALGLPADTAWTSGAGTVVSLLKAIATAAQSDGNPQPVTLAGTTVPLPAGAATATGVAAIVTALGSPLQAGGNVAVTGTLPLPTGAATAAGVAAVVSALGSPLQAGGNVAVTASALPAGAATATGVNSAAQSIVTALGTPLQAGGNVAVTASALPAGAATAAGVAAIVTALGTPAQAGGKIDTVVQGTAADRGGYLGFTGTGGTGGASSTTLTMTAISGSGIPRVGQKLVGTGITAGTLVTAVSGTSPNFVITMSAAMTVAAGTAISSNGGNAQVPANPARRWMRFQNQSDSYGFYFKASATPGDVSTGPDSQYVGPRETFETPSHEIGVLPINMLGEGPNLAVFAREG